MRSLLRVNLDYIKAVNKCDEAAFQKFMTELIVSRQTEDRVKKLFTQKRYIWNIIRGKDFYKLMAKYVIRVMQMGNSMEEGSAIYDFIINSTKSINVKAHFTKAIMKDVPFLTLTSIQYMSEQRLQQILNDMSFVYVDPMLAPFIERIERAQEMFV